MVIYLYGGKCSTLVDSEYSYLSKYVWYRDSYGYAVRKVKPLGGKWTNIKMHREIIDAPKDKFVDHINGDRLDNRRANLRLCNNSENLRNRGKNKNNACGYKGVYWKKDAKKFVAKIYDGDKSIHLGYFEFPEDGAKAYDEKAKEIFGEFANLNFE